MPLDSLTDVRVFVQVVESAGLSAASRVLGVPPNTISRTIARLESSLGVRLLLRTTRTMSLTDSGQLFYDQALKLLEAARGAEEIVAPANDGLSGLIRMAVRTTTVQFGVVPDLLGLLAQHPKLRVQLRVTDDDVDLVASGLDLALRVGDQPDSALRGKSLGAVVFVMAATSSYLDRAGRPRHPADLAMHECIRSLSGRTESLWQLWGPRGKRAAVATHGRFECNDVRTQREAIYAGFGIGVRPIGEVQRAATAQELEPVLSGWSLEPIPVRVILPSREPSRHRARAVEAVIDLMSAAIRRMGPE